MQDGANRLVENLDKAMSKHGRTGSQNYNTVGSGTIPTPRQMERRFKKNDKLQLIEDREYLNPGFYDPDHDKFDMRLNHQGKNLTVKNNSQFLQSAFWNPRTHKVLTRKPESTRHYIHMNTKSFAKKFNRKAPKYKIRQSYKQDCDKPQPGYYDTEKAFDKTFGLEVVNSVNMDQEPARKDLFAG